MFPRWDFLAGHALGAAPGRFGENLRYHRAGTLAAFTNAVLLVLLSLWLGYEAIQRLRARWKSSRAG